jgi:Bacterial membrane protein YfhO
VRTRQLLAALTLAILPPIYFSPAITGKTVLVTGDGWSYSILVRILSGEMLAKGILLLWNPYTFAGMPFLAAVQPGVLYPPNWGFALFPPGVAMNILVITTYHVALIGAYLYARAIEINRIGALVTGSAFAFGGFMICHLEQINFIAAAAWLGWVLWAIEKTHRSASWREAWRWVIAGAVVIALEIFAGLPQATFYISLVSGAYILFLLIRRPEPGQSRLRFTAAVAATIVCGVLLSLIQLLPTIELQRQGERAAISYEAFAAFPMSPHYWLTLVFPFFFGGGLPPYKVGGWDHWWLHKWACGYVGMLSLLLVSVAWLSRRQRALVWFWTAVAICAIVLSVANYLPFGINQLLYRVPFYNMFRGSYRHTYEFTFAFAVIAGIGAESLARVEWKHARQLLWRAVLVLATVVAVVTLIYRYFAQRLGAAGEPGAGANSLANPEAFVPLLLFVMSAGVVWFYARRRTMLAGLLLIAALMLDLASFGWLTYWNVANAEVLKRLADPPAVQAIKGRESDLQSFRVVSHAHWPFNYNFELLNHANLTIARGLQSASGYDPMRLPRSAALAGDMDIFGVIKDTNAMEVSHQGFNLLNVKYMIRELPGKIDGKREPVIIHDGIQFKGAVPETRLEPGSRVALSVGSVTASELAMVTTLTNAGYIPEGATVARIKLHTVDGRVIERELQAGRDTSEWAHDRADVRSGVRHRRARVIESWPEAGFEGHRYLARLGFDRAEIERIEMDYAQSEAELVIARAVLFDAVTGSSWPIETLALPHARWQNVGTFGEIGLYENLKVLPRAWFVKRVEALPSREVLQSIKLGKLPGGAEFDPSETALVEKEDFGEREVSLPPAGIGAGAKVKIVRYEPHRIELESHNSEAGFLILSEVYYRGWDATVDGIKVPVERVDYALRGIRVPAGDHRVEFFFRAPTFRTGAVYSALGMILLFAGYLGSLKSRERIRNKRNRTKQ